jgi:hypothetical protein
VGNLFASSVERFRRTAVGRRNRDEMRMTANNWLKGMVAGFVATIVLSALMLMKATMGVMPELTFTSKKLAARR